jgi:hypothetical protein
MIIAVSPNNFPFHRTRIFAEREGFAPVQIRFVRFAPGKIVIKNAYMGCKIYVVGQPQKSNGLETYIDIFEPSGTDRHNCVGVENFDFKQEPKFIKKHQFQHVFPIQEQIFQFVQKFNKPLHEEYLEELKRFKSLGKYQETPIR